MLARALLHRALVVALVSLGVACDADDPRSAGSAGGTGGSAAGCQPGEVATEDGCQSAGIAPDRCAPGFVPDGRDGCSAVLPAEVCGPGSMAVPGETTCREVAPCDGDGRWGSIPVDASTQYVDGSYAGIDSDGSQDKPWTTIQAGIDAAPARGLVAVASGIYTEDVVVEGSPVRIRGRCPAMVEVRGSATGAAAVLVKDDASGTQIGDLAIRGGSAGVVVTGSEAVTLERVWIHDTGDRGLVAQDDLGPTEVAAIDSLIEGADDIGAFIGAATARFERSVVRWTRADPARLSSGRGISIQDRPGGEAARGVVHSSVVEGNTDLGVFVWGSEITVEASVVRDTQARPDGGGGWGLAIQDHAERATETWACSCPAPT